VDGPFVDYYEFLGLPPSASRQEIAERVRALIKEWHPDVCRDPRAHEMTVRIVGAKQVLLDEELRRDYDAYREAYLSGGYRSEDWDHEWETRSQRINEQAEHDANLSLENLLSSVIVLAVAATAVAFGAAAVGTEYAWKGTDRFHDRNSELSFGKRFWAGIGGWACVICLIVPGTSIITFLCFYWAFFPGPERKFIGLANVLNGMLISFLIVVPATICIGALIIKGFSG
jgi:hypothetical protein